MKKSELMKTNPLLQPFAEGGPDLFPAFDKIKPEHFKPALDLAMRETRRAFQAVRDNQDPPTFENTIIAFEKATGMLDYVYQMLWYYTYAARSPEVEQLEDKYLPRLTKFYAEMYKDGQMYKRVKKLEGQSDKLPYTQQQKYLIEVYGETFRACGCGLSKTKKERCLQLDSELEKLGLKFDKNMQDELKGYGLVIDDLQDLKGLPESFIEAAAAEAEERGMPGKWVLTAEEPVEMALQFFCENRALRERYYKETANLCTTADGNNLAIMKKMLELRYERAQLFGYKAYTDYAMTFMMTYTKKPVFDFLNELKTRVAPAARRQHNELKRFAKADGIRVLEPWDFRYYFGKMREARLHFDTEALRPYFKLENVLNGAFQHSEKLFGVKFSYNPDRPKIHKDTFAFDVTDEKTGDFLGVMIIDPYLRDDKASGNQFCIGLMSHGDYAGKPSAAISVIHLNLARPVGGNPTLLTEEEVKTVFHELGHGMHQILGKADYRLLSGLNCIMSDFAELPSQLNELWGLEPEVLKTYAFHWKTGEVMPDHLMRGLRENDRFMGCHKMLREVRRAYTDLAIHNRNPKYINLASFEPRYYRDNFPQVNFNNLAPVLPRFQHIATLGMEANYYSYLWSEAHDADAYQMFRQNGLYDPATCERLRQMLRAAGTRASSDLYKEFRGRAMTIDALCERYGIESRNRRAIFNYQASIDLFTAANQNTIDPDSQVTEPNMRTAARRQNGPTPS